MFTPRNDTAAVCCLLPVLFGVFLTLSMLCDAWSDGAPNVLMLVFYVLVKCWVSKPKTFRYDKAKTTSITIAVTIIIVTEPKNPKSR